MKKTINFLIQHFQKYGYVSVKLRMPKTFEILESVITFSLEEPEFMNLVDPEATDYCPAWFCLNSKEANEIFLKYLTATKGDFERIKFWCIPPSEPNNDEQQLIA